MITYELALLIGGIALIIYVITALFLKVKINKIAIGCLFIAYLTAVISITIFPIQIDFPIIYSAGVTWYNFIPFKTIAGMLRYGMDMTSFIQIFGNICLSVPFGIFVMMTMKNKKWWKILICVFLFTLSIELLQLVIGLAIDNMYRTVDIDDVILNVIGGLIGCGIYKILPNRLKSLF